MLSLPRLLSVTRSSVSFTKICQRNVPHWVTQGGFLSDLCAVPAAADSLELRRPRLRRLRVESADATVTPNLRPGGAAGPAAHAPANSEHEGPDGFLGARAVGPAGAAGSAAEDERAVGPGPGGCSAQRSVTVVWVRARGSLKGSPARNLQSVGAPFPAGRAWLLRNANGVDVETLRGVLRRRAQGHRPESPGRRGDAAAA